MNDQELDKKVLGTVNTVPELDKKDKKFINDLDKMKTDRQKESAKHIDELNNNDKEVSQTAKKRRELQEEKDTNIYELHGEVRSGEVRIPEEENISREERKEENAEETGAGQKEPEFDWSGYEAKARERFTESEEFEDKKHRINIQKNINFERINEGFMKVSYVGPDKEGKAKMFYLYGYGSLQSSILYIQAVYGTGYLTPGNHTLDLKNGYSVEWYSYSRYIKEASQIELELEKWESTQTDEAKAARIKEMQEANQAALKMKSIELKALEYDMLKSKLIVKLFRLIK